ncbi:MAG: glycosyltransferase family 4 protein [Gelidibacter sp.]|nr:glycosyltransferase family 4 protein [Gelidibacter sp.]
MKLIVNCSSLHQGGGIQVALSLLEEFKDFRDNEYYIIYTSKFLNLINFDSFPDNFKFYFLKYSSSDLFKFRQSLKRLKEIEVDVQPDCVLTVFGPSYWRPKAIHVMGFALGHFLYPDSPFWKVANLKEKFLFSILKTIKIWQIKQNADYFHIETEDAKNRLSRYHNVPLENIFVASNSHHKIFNGNYQYFKLPKKRKNEFRLITISAFYSHKNIKIINKLVNELCKIKDFEFTFFVTLPQPIFDKNFIKSNRIINLGPVKIEDCPSIYEQSDALFLPTLLEIFSASYLEAMKMEIPILTSDLSFAHDICGDAALYFNPLDVKNISNSIVNLARNKQLREVLKQNGKIRLKKFDNSRERSRKILNICNNIIN